MRLYHFISAQHGLAAIRDRRFKLSTYDNLNDPFEMYATDHRDRKIRRAFVRMKDMCTSELGLLCCSKSWHSTLLWSHYADKHKGLALILEVPEKAITQVEYRSDRMPVTHAMMDAEADCPARDSISARMLRTKADEWSYEDEARIFFDISKATLTDGMYFTPFNETVELIGVVLGPLCTVSTKEIMKALPVGNSLTVIRSRIAFGSYKVVRNLLHPELVLNHYSPQDAASADTLLVIS
jgi:hypothetical protein